MSVTTSPAFDPWDAIEKWKILDLGRRPEDFMVRDLLVGSIIRDPRSVALQRHLRNPPSWVDDSVKHLDRDKQRQASQMLTIWFAHFEALSKLLSTIKTSRYCSEAFRRFQRVWNCTPVGALVTHRYRGDKYRHRLCGRPRICPFCHARRMVELWKVLNPVLEGKADPGSLLVRALVSIEDARIRPIGMGDCWEPWQANAQYLNQEIRPQLLDRAKYLGIRDGLTTYLAGPYGKKDGGLIGLRHELGLLGHISLESESAKQKLLRRLKWGERKEPRLPLNLMGNPVWVDWVLLRANRQSALRFMLAGTGVRYPTKLLPLQGPTCDWRGRLLPDSLPALLPVQPFYRFDDECMLHFDNAMKDLKMISPFGKWKQLLGHREKAMQEKRLTIRDGLCLQRNSPRRRLARANLAREESAAEVRQKTLVVAQEVWPSVRCTSRNGIGRPAYRVKLAQALKDKGHPVGQRVLAWLVKELLSQESKQTEPRQSRADVSEQE